MTEDDEKVIEQTRARVVAIGITTTA